MKGGGWPAREDNRPERWTRGSGPFPLQYGAPVRGPPCILHRPLGMAAALQGARLSGSFAPQRGALPGLPGRLPCLSQPSPRRRFACGSLLI